MDLDISHVVSRWLALPGGELLDEDSDCKAGHQHPLQKWLWENHRIEVPIIRWGDQILIRVSAHLYNTLGETTLLANAVHEFVNRQ